MTDTNQNGTSDAKTNTQIALSAWDDVADIRKLFISIDVSNADITVNSVAGHIKTLKNYVPNFAVLTMTVDQAGNLPDGYAVCVIPQTQKVNGKIAITGCVVAQIPDAELVSLHDEPDANGQDWVLGIVRDALLTKLANHVRSANQTEVQFAPKTVADYLVRKSGAGFDGIGIGTYNDLAKVFVDLLKAGIPTLTKNELRLCLSDASFAAARYTIVPAAYWVDILSKMAEYATAQNMDANVFEVWSKTRDETHEDEDDGEHTLVSLDDLNFG